MYLRPLGLLLLAALISQTPLFFLDASEDGAFS